MTRSLNYVIAGLLALILSTGCGSGLQGPLFEPIARLPQDKAVVYVYWPDENFNTEFTLKANDNTLTTLKTGGYYPYIAEPGPIEFSTKLRFKFLSAGALEAATAPQMHLTVDAQPGRVYFVRCDAIHAAALSLSSGSGRRLQMGLVPERIAQDEIKVLKRLPSHGK